MTVLDTLAPMLPLRVSIAGRSTDDPTLTPPGYSLPVGVVTATPEFVSSEDTTLNGYIVMLAGSGGIRAITVRVDIDAGHPLPTRLGQLWANILPGSVVSIAETHTDRNADTTYTQVQVKTNTLKATTQIGLSQAYYSGAIEGRMLIGEGG